VNVAARLQSKAAPGEILVSHSTYLLTQHAFRFESLGLVALKGKAESVPAYRVDDALDISRSTRGLRELGLATPLVGRQTDLTELTAAFERMLTGRTQLVSIVGEAGAGKSRLLSEFLGELRAAGRLTSVAVRNAACSSVGESIYAVPAALLRDAYGVTPSDPPSAVRQKIASALAALGADQPETQRVSAFLGYVLGLETNDSRTRYLEPEQLKQQIFFAALAVIGLGGFASVPTVAAAIHRRIPAIILEQNVIPGRATRLFSRRVSAVCTAFADNDIGRLVEDFILQGGVSTEFIKWVPYDGVGRSVRNGLNFTERGFGARGALGISDRGNSAASQLSSSGCVGASPW
jgi:hypothetical protein